MATALDKTGLMAFITVGHRTAKVACVKADGSPVVSPVWFIVDDEALVFTTMSSSLKCRCMVREPRVSVCVENEAYPYGFATIQGSALVSELPLDELKRWTTRIAERYVPADQVVQYGERNAVAEERLIRVSIERFIAYEGIAD
ncbi:MAG: PPOX class F420-dependent oxidoreductase [Pseudomonadota bacterium]